MQDRQNGNPMSFWARATLIRPPEDAYEGMLKGLCLGEFIFCLADSGPEALGTTTAMKFLMLDVALLLIFGAWGLHNQITTPQRIP